MLYYIISIILYHVFFSFFLFFKSMYVSLQLYMLTIYCLYRFMHVCYAAVQNCLLQHFSGPFQLLQISIFLGLRGWSEWEVGHARPMLKISFHQPLVHWITLGNSVFPFLCEDFLRSLNIKKNKHS